MDAVIFLILGVYLCYKVKVQIEDIPSSANMTTRRNPNFFRDENAFMKYYNELMRK